jgi:hypothetical protein
LAFDGVQPGKYSVVIRAERHHEARVGVEVLAVDAQESLSVELEPIESQRSVAGVVSDADGTPLSSALVSQGIFETLTDGQGRFELCSAGEPEPILVECPGYLSQRFPLPDTGMESPLDLRLRNKAGRIDAYLREDARGPMTLSLFAAEGDRPLQTAFGPACAFDGLPPGTYTLIASWGRDTDVLGDCELREGEHLRIVQPRPDESR